MDAGSKRRRIAFYAPLKSPDHPTPSGDRAMARLLLGALDLADFQPVQVSNLRSFSHEPSEAKLANLQAEAETCKKRILENFEITGKPDAWLSYHPFYKSPDLLGPPISDRLGIPYITVEASHAPKRHRDGWQPWQKLTEDALRQGAVHFFLTERDRIGLAAFLGRSDRLLNLPPFLDTMAFGDMPSTRQKDRPVKLVTAAMMRPGDKLESYRFLARALAFLPSSRDWHLTIIGDGPARDAVETAFAHLDPARLTWRGAVDADEVRARLWEAELYVWPGFGEAYGMAYLEAQAAGLPVLALDCGGISEVVRNGETGILVGPGSPENFAEALDAMISRREKLARMGQAGRRFVLEERDIRRAAAILKAGIEQALQ